MLRSFHVGEFYGCVLMMVDYRNGGCVLNWDHCGVISYDPLTLKFLLNTSPAMMAPLCINKRFGGYLIHGMSLIRCRKCECLLTFKLLTS